MAEKKINRAYEAAASHTEEECSNPACKLMRKNPLKWAPGSILYRSLEKVYEGICDCKNASIADTVDDCWSEEEKRRMDCNSLTCYVVKLNPFKYCPELALYNLTQKLYDKFGNCDKCNNKYNKKG